MPPTPPRLPQDIIDNIIAELTGHVETLKRCSVVSSSFRDPSQRVLFQWISTGMHPNSWSTVEKVIRSNPRLASFVKALHLQLPEFERQSGTYIFEYLTSLRTLHIENSYHISWSAWWERCWTTVSRELKAEIVNLLVSPKLERLILANVAGFPLAFLKRCSQLKEVQLQGFQVHDTSEEGAAAASALIRSSQATASGQGYLNSLAGDSCKQLLPILRGPSAPLSFSRLKRYYGDVKELEVFQAILDLSAGSLEVVHAMTIAERLPFSHMDLSRLTNLRVIRFSIPHTSLPSSLMWASHALETLTERNVLEQAVFTLLDSDSFLGRAIYLLQQTLPEFFLVGLVTSIDRETGTPRPASASIPVLNANPLDVQTYIDEDNETIYSPKVRLSYTPPVALPPPFPATLHIEGLPLYLASSVFIRHTLNALYSDLNVELRKVIVKTPRSKESVSGEVTFEEPKAPLQEVRRERDKRLLVGFCVTGKSRVSGARGQWEVNSTYSFSPNTGLIDRHVIDSIYPPPHQAVYDSLRMSLGKVFGFGIEEGSQARSNSAACSASSGIPGGDRNGKEH
ncbi:hypothetical protein LshimejAT787_0904030 [Lyophyllum shimeji]|uniref:Uncharacterized protein n=1 Tax=Lyophyllum shimeji TaxID=47721 RepID=A0A9P3PSE2_LYOSH|nr:hypothetical protein LshimejAT787_0904030 [Lyophyllum shimeji]